MLAFIYGDLIWTTVGLLEVFEADTPRLTPIVFTLGLARGHAAVGRAATTCTVVNSIETALNDDTKVLLRVFIQAHQLFDVDF